MGGARGEFDWKPYVTIRVLNALTNEVEETHTGHAHLNIEAIEAKQEMGPG